MRQKKVLIAGGAGYIGHVLAPFIQSHDYDVTVVDTCWFGNKLPESIKVIEANIFDLKKSDIEHFDSVIFLAGLSNDPMAEFSPKDNFIYNTGLPAYFGFIAREALVKKLIFAGSCSVYGYTRNSTFTEEDDTYCNYPYGASKMQAEQALLALQTEDFKVICLRQGTVSGVSPRMRFDLAINTMVKNAILKNEITLSNSLIWRPILGLTDLCQAYLLALNSEDKNGIYNVASFNATVGELAFEVKEVIDSVFKRDVKITDNHVQDYRNYKVSWNKIQEDLGYKPSQTAKGIITEVIEKIESLGDLTKPEYYNIEVFKQLKTL